MTRWQHIIPPAVLTLVGLWVCYVSYTSEPAAAFLFPRIVATVFAVLAVWGLASAVLGDGSGNQGISAQMFRNMLPGIVVGAIYIFWAAKGLGFYTATALSTFVLVALYDPAPHNRLWTWGKRFAITAVFVAVMYLLFSVLLNVYTPKEKLF